MHEHANCLEQLLDILSREQMVEVCPFSELVMLSPIDDDFFRMQQQLSRRYTHKSEEELLDRGKKDLNLLLSVDNAKC